MIKVDIKFLKHIALIIRLLLELLDGKYKSTPGERQYKITQAARTCRQLDYIIREAEDEEALSYLRRGLVKEATW